MGQPHRHHAPNADHLVGITTSPLATPYDRSSASAPHRRRRGGRLLAIPLAAILLVSCTPTSPVPSTSTPQPTFQCTPESGVGDPSPCTSDDYTSMQERDALYAEAERVLRRAHHLSYELWGQRLPMSDELASLLSGEALAENTADLAGAAESAVTVVGEPHIAWVVRAPSVTNKGSILALEWCMEPGTFQYTEDGTPRPIPPLLQQSFFVSVEGSLRVDSGIFYEAKSC